MKRILARHSPLVILAMLCIALAVLSPEFRQPVNLQRVAYRTSVVGIVAIGQALVIVVGGIDLSVGSVAALAGVVAGLTMKACGHEDGAALEYPFYAACLGACAGSMAGLTCGLINGTLCAKGRIPPFIATLGMMLIARGTALLMSGGVPVSGLPDAFYYLGGTRGWYIPVSITAGIAAIFGVVLAFTRFGRAVYATGGNVTGARLSGIAVARVRITAFSVCGLLAGFGGVMLASRTSIATPSAGEGMELDAIAACVIGGASLMGGEGGALGSLAGALIMNVLDNFCRLRNLDVYWQKVLVGALIIGLVYYDGWRKRRAGLTRE